MGTKKKLPKTTNGSTKQADMGNKKKIPKTANRTTKQAAQNSKGRTKIKKMSHKFILDNQGDSKPSKKNKIKKMSHKFILDKQGGSKPSKVSFANETRTKNALGHDPLLQKERELMVDLFGDDGESMEKMETHTDDLEEGEQPESEVKTEVEEKDVSSSVVEDPLDIHPQDEEKQKAPAWVDEDDHDIRVKDVVAGMSKARGSRDEREVSQEQYIQLLQQKFNQTMGVTPKWAQLHLYEPNEDVQEVVLEKGTGDYLAHGTSLKLDKRRIRFRRQMDINYASRTEGAIITAVEFNPKYHMALVTGFLRSVVGAASLFKVDGTHNHLINSVKFPKFPIKHAKFLCDGRKFVAGSSQYNHFYMYDLEAAQETRIPSNLGNDGHMKNVLVSPNGELLVFIGKSGQLHLFDADSLSLVDTLHASGDVTSAAFSCDGSRLYSHTTEGDVYIWDMHARACIHRFYDNGCIHGTSIAVSPNNQYLACGSSSGVVNVYDLADVMSQSPDPVKMLPRLRSTASALAFNSSSEILATASDVVKDAIKLVHLPSMTYFMNFPESSWNLNRIHAVNFSPQSGFLAAGNNSGRALLFRLHHFNSY